MYETAEFRNGLKVEIEGKPYEIVFFQHVKPGKGNAFTRTKLKNLIDGRVLEITYKSGDKVAKADVEIKEFQYLYAEGDSYVFMDNANYEQVYINSKTLGDAVNYMQENMLLNIILYKGNAVGVDLPYFVNLVVVECEPATKGDTVSGATKNAKVSTGLVVQVPLYIAEGEKIKIDTRDARFVERSKG